MDDVYPTSEGLEVMLHYDPEIVGTDRDFWMPAFMSALEYMDLVGIEPFDKPIFSD
jgi:hypothetical protein